MAARRTSSQRSPKSSASSPAPPSEGDSPRGSDAPESQRRPNAIQRLFAAATVETDNSRLETAARDFLLEHTASWSTIKDRYNVLYLYDHSTLVRSDADRIYRAVSGFDRQRPILLVLYSTGGAVEPAYLISKLCRDFSNERFVVAVPRQAKSAATLICCGANQVHMGHMSELGPIDPQIDRLPALALKQAVEHLADLVHHHPGAADMFASYLARSLRPELLGYYERVAESAVQYAERLLAKCGAALPSAPSEIAYRLVYSYKDHGFVIDLAEAQEIFGSPMITTGTDEYRFANDAYEALDLCHQLFGFQAERSFYLIGTPQDGWLFRRTRGALGA